MVCICLSPGSELVSWPRFAGCVKALLATLQGFTTYMQVSREGERGVDQHGKRPSQHRECRQWAGRVCSCSSSLAMLGGDYTVCGARLLRSVELVSGNLLLIVPRGYSSHTCV